MSLKEFLSAVWSGTFAALIVFGIVFACVYIWSVISAQA